MSCFCGTQIFNIFSLFSLVQINLTIINITTLYSHYCTNTISTIFSIFSVHFLTSLLFPGKPKLGLCLSFFSRLYLVLNNWFSMFFSFVTCVQFIVFLYDMSSINSNHSLLHRSLSTFFITLQWYVFSILLSQTYSILCGCCDRLPTGAACCKPQERVHGL